MRYNREMMAEALSSGDEPMSGGNLALTYILIDSSVCWATIGLSRNRVLHPCVVGHREFLCADNTEGVSMHSGFRFQALLPHTGYGRLRTLCALPRFLLLLCLSFFFSLYFATPKRRRVFFLSFMFVCFVLFVFSGAQE